MLLALWPYACWKDILAREPNTVGGNLRRHKWTTMLLGSFFAVVLCVATAFGIQNGSDRMATAEIERNQKDFQEVAAKLWTLKNRDLRTTMAYIDTYDQIEPLVDEFDAKLTVYESILAEGSRKDKERGPLNIQRFVGKHEQWSVWDSQVFGLLRRNVELTRKQVAVMKQMAELPDREQADFWQSHFLPLIHEEDELRQNLASAMKTKPE